MTIKLCTALAPGDRISIEGEAVEVLTPPVRFVRFGGGTVNVLVRRADGRGSALTFASDIERVEVAS